MDSLNRGKVDIAGVLSEKCINNNEYRFTSKVKGCEDKQYFAIKLPNGKWEVSINVYCGYYVYVDTLDKVRDIIDTQHLSRLAIQIDSVRFMEGA